MFKNMLGKLKRPNKGIQDSNKAVERANDLLLQSQLKRDLGMNQEASKNLESLGSIEMTKVKTLEDEIKGFENKIVVGEDIDFKKEMAKNREEYDRVRKESAETIQKLYDSNKTKPNKK